MKSVSASKPIDMRTCVEFSRKDRSFRLAFRRLYRKKNGGESLRTSKLSVSLSHVLFQGLARNLTVNARKMEWERVLGYGVEEGC
jgi:hypothetical protein